METDAAVIRAKVEVVARASELLGVDQQILGPGADDHIDRHSPVVQPLGLGINWSRPETARYEYISLSLKSFLVHLDEGRRVAEGADHVAKELSLLLGYDSR